MENEIIENNEEIVSEDELIINEEHEITDDERIQMLEQEIRNLTSQLTSPVSSIGDYKVIKCYEANILQQPLPYDIELLHEERQKVRSQINEIQSEIDEIKKKYEPIIIESNEESIEEITEESNEDNEDDKDIEE